LPQSSSTVGPGCQDGSTAGGSGTV
jgi:hypothetical protein